MTIRALALIAALSISAAAQGQLQCPGYPPRPIDDYSQRLLGAQPDVVDANFCKAFFPSRYQACIVTRNYLKDIQNNSTNGQTPCLADDSFRRAPNDPNNRANRDPRHDEQAMIVKALQQQNRAN